LINIVVLINISAPSS